MVNRARWKWSAFFLVLSLVISPAAFAAAENSGQDKPAAETEAKSYLPPWMQGKGGNDNASVSAPAATPTPDNNATQGSKTAAASDDTAKRKVRGASQGHRYHRHGSPNAVFSGFAGLFGQ